MEITSAVPPALLDAGTIGRPALLQMTRECYLTRSFLEDRRWYLDRQAAAGGIMDSTVPRSPMTARLKLARSLVVVTTRSVCARGQ